MLKTQSVYRCIYIHFVYILKICINVTLFFAHNEQNVQRSA